MQGSESTPFILQIFLEHHFCFVNVPSVFTKMVWGFCAVRSRGGAGSVSDPASSNSSSSSDPISEPAASAISSAAILRASLRVSTSSLYDRSMSSTRFFASISRLRRSSTRALSAWCCTPRCQV